MLTNTLQEYEIAGKNSAGEFGPWVPLKLHRIAVSKTLRIHNAHIRPSVHTETFWYDLRWLAPNVVGGGIHFYHAAVLLPIGATITGFRIRGYRGNGSDLVRGTLYRVPSSGASAVPVSSTVSISTTSSWQTVEDTGLSETIAGDALAVLMELTSAASALDAKVMFAEIDYDVPDFETTL